jgi:3',5'-cyclic AMP phosphodiesterase CpdA
MLTGKGQGRERKTCRLTYSGDYMSRQDTTSEFSFLLPEGKTWEGRKGDMHGQQQSIRLEQTVPSGTGDKGEGKRVRIL